MQRGTEGSGDIYIYVSSSLPLLSHVHPCLHSFLAALLFQVIFPGDEVLCGSKLSQVILSIYSLFTSVIHSPSAQSLGLHQLTQHAYILIFTPSFHFSFFSFIYIFTCSRILYLLIRTFHICHICRFETHSFLNLTRRLGLPHAHANHHTHKRKQYRHPRNHPEHIHGAFGMG